MNQEKKIETLYTHDALGNLTEVILPNNDEISYIYDGRNRLISKQVNGIVEYRLLYGGQLAPVAKVDASGNTIETYIYGLGINSPDYIVKAGSVYRVIKDHLGSTRMIVNANTGDIVKDIHYSEFGKITEETGTFNTIFGFAGGIRDTDTSLTKFGARWYDSTTGRWLEKEPLGFAGSDNFYSYCGADPINYIDLSGLWRASAHAELTIEAMRKMGFDDYSIIVALNANIDADDNQSDNALHYMPGTKDRAEEIIQSHLQNSINCEKAGNHRQAMIELGKALHTLQDKFSHEEFGSWLNHVITLGLIDSTTLQPIGFDMASDASKNLLNEFINKADYR